MSFRRSRRETPNVVLAPAPHAREDIIELQADPGLLQAYVDRGLNYRLGEYCGLVHGNVREQLSSDQWVEHGGTLGLLAATALFQGVQRPLDRVANDEDVYAYVTSPGWSYAYPQRSRHGDFGPLRIPKPDNSVFVTFASIREGQNRILHWEWTLASPKEPSLPDQYATRYYRKVW